MSFIDNLQYLRSINIVDEFGERGDPRLIEKFYIVMRFVDDSGSPIEVSAMELGDAILKKHLIITDYIGFKDYSFSPYSEGDTDFVVSDVKYKTGNTIISVLLKNFQENATLSLKITDNTGIIMSSAYLGGIPSCFYLQKKTS